MPINNKHTALLLVEGETEVEFYNLLADTFFHPVPKKIKNLEGNFNINHKIIDAAFSFSRDNTDKTFDVYVCVDQERVGTPVFKNDYVLTELKKIKKFNSLHSAIANLMMESLFFIDIDSIYKFLRADKVARNPGKYKNFRVLRHQDLSKLFKSFDRSYSKGKKCHGFVKSLNLLKISNSASEISMLIEKVNNKGKLKK